MRVERLFIVVTLFLVHNVYAQNISSSDWDPVYIEEKVGQLVPVDNIIYATETGDSARLSELLDKPTLLTLVYYRCPGICTPLLSGFVEVLNRIDLEPGKDFKALTLSFNELEGPDLALKKKQSYYGMLNRPFPEEAWRWLTGDNWNIKKLTWAVGFHFLAGVSEFSHPTVVIVLDPAGRIVRYFEGTQFAEEDLKLALWEATPTTERSLLASLTLLLKRFDPKENRYKSPPYLLLGGAIVLLGLAVLAWAVFRKKRQYAIPGDASSSPTAGAV